MSRGKCSFWKLGFSLLVKVLWKMLVLESLLVKVSWKTVVLEAWTVTLGEISWCAAGVSRKSVKQKRPARLSSKSALSRVSSKGVKQECQKQECQERVSRNITLH